MIFIHCYGDQSYAGLFMSKPIGFNGASSQVLNSFPIGMELLQKAFLIDNTPTLLIPFPWTEEMKSNYRYPQKIQIIHEKEFL